MASGRTIRTPKKREAFLSALALTGNVSEAAAACAIGRTAAYDWRRDDETFAADWDAALDEAADRMEREAFRRAVEGTEKPVFGSLGQGRGSGEVGRIREYSDTLLIFLLKAARPEKFRERTEVRHTGLTPEQAKQLPDDEIRAKLKEKGLL